MRSISKKEVKETIPIVWNKISEYLHLNLSWDEFLLSCKQKFKNFSGFKLLKSKYPPCWYAGFKEEKNKSYVYLAYSTKVEKDFECQLAHELVHLFRGTIHRNKFLSSLFVSNIFEEAICDAVAVKSTGKREKEFKDKGLYNIVEISALEQIIFKFSDNKIRKLALMPTNYKEAKEIENFVIKLLSSKEFKKNVERIWKAKIKEKVYYHF